MFIRLKGCSIVYSGTTVNPLDFVEGMSTVEQYSIEHDDIGRHLRFVGHTKNVQGGLQQRNIKVKDLKIHHIITIAQTNMWILLCGSIILLM